MGAVRFEGVDILDSLGQIMELHTQHYKDAVSYTHLTLPTIHLA